VSLADLETTIRDDVVVARITGEVDLSNAEGVGSAIIADTPAEVRGVVLDLSPVTFLDSVGILVIYGIRESLLARGQRLALVIPAVSAVSAPLKIAGVWEHMQPAETVEAALLALDRDETTDE
jgi:anti-anti-sigma factor